MKNFKYTIFLSILICIFFVVYQQSDKKGFDRLKMSLKTATLIAAILAGLTNNPVESIKPDVPNNSTSIERSLSNQELDSLDDPNSRVVLVKTGDSSPSVPTSPGRQQPNTGTASGYRAAYVNQFRIPPKLVHHGLGAGGGGGNGGGAPEFDDQCPVPKKPESHELNYDYQLNSQQNKDKNKKRRNSHLDRQVEINGYNFEIERAQVEAKTARHGVDLGLAPDLGADGKPILDQKTKKPMAKANKENYELFVDNLEKFMKNSEMREGYFRKGRENQQEVFHFFDEKTSRVASFNKEDGKFISFWKMDKPGQLNQFLNNNNVI